MCIFAFATFNRLSLDDRAMRALSWDHVGRVRKMGVLLAFTPLLEVGVFMGASPQTPGLAALELDVIIYYNSTVYLLNIFSLRKNSFYNKKESHSLLPLLKVRVFIGASPQTPGLAALELDVILYNNFTVHLLDIFYF